MHFLLLFCFLNFSLPHEGPGHNPQQEVIYDSSPVQEMQFDEDQINSYREDPAFDYSENVSGETWWTKFKKYIALQWSKLMSWIFGDYQAEGILLIFLKILPYLIIVGVLFFIGWLFNKLNPAAEFLESTSTNETYITGDEEIIQSRDIKKMIEAASKEKNFNLAIRYQYLYLLQLLTRKQIISYESSKTNAEYSREILTSNLRNLFNHLSWVYDYTWYGSFEADQATYQSVEKKFMEIRELILEGDE